MTFVPQPIEVLDPSSSPSNLNILMLWCRVVTKSKTQLVSSGGMAHAVECLKTLTQPVRLRIIQMLLLGEHTVGELAEACETQSHDLAASEAYACKGFLEAEVDIGTSIPSRRRRTGRHYGVHSEALRSYLNLGLSQPSSFSEFRVFLSDGEHGPLAFSRLVPSGRKPRWRTVKHLDAFYFQSSWPAKFRLITL